MARLYKTAKEDPNSNYVPPMDVYRREAIAAAIDLEYGEDVKEKLMAAKSEAEISRIMITARKKKFDTVY